MSLRSLHGPRSRFLVPLIGLTLVLAACGGDDGDGSTDGDAVEGTTVDVTMRDWAIAVEPGEVDAGTVTFAATNEGPTTHEFEIFSGELPDGGLPVSDGVADTEGLTLVDEVEDVFAGSTGELTLDLEPGSYAVICNLPDHYEQGMSTTLTVS